MSATQPLRDLHSAGSRQISARGPAPLVMGQREVTVVFVDLQGFTAFAEPLSPAEVFSFLSRFTSAASRAIERHGGIVVEFNGDGVMAVFGARGEARKERSALAAARELRLAVGRIAPEARRASRRSPPVRIGLATGLGFAGLLRAADRSVWSVVGTTTNRAARLQRLARRLDASIVLDAATRAGAGPAGDLVPLGPVRLRGLTRSVAAFGVFPRADA